MPTTKSNSFEVLTISKNLMSVTFIEIVNDFRKSQYKLHILYTKLVCLILYNNSVYSR